MKKLCIVFAMLFMAFNVQAQETTMSDADQEKMTRMMELMSQTIEMDVNTELFSKVSTNAYVSEDPKAVIMAMLTPEDYETSKEKMKNDVGDKMDVKDKGETEINGVKVLYMKGTTEAEGSDLNVEMYCIGIDDETSLMFIGMVDKTADAKYAEAIEKAKNSVIK